VTTTSVSLTSLKHTHWLLLKSASARHQSLIQKPRPDILSTVAICRRRCVVSGGGCAAKRGSQICRFVSAGVAEPGSLSFSSRFENLNDY
jgi:hypothetical protein